MDKIRKAELFIKNDLLIAKEWKKVYRKFDKTKDFKIPGVSIAVTLFVLKSEELKETIYHVAGKPHLMSMRVLHRSLVEYDLRFKYIFVRYLQERNDSVGEDYLIFCRLSEALDFAKSMKDLFDQYGKPPKEDPFRALEHFLPSIKKYSKDEIKEKAARFRYKNIIRYLHTNLYKNKDVEFDFLATFLKYSRLSSHVHGGPMGDLEMIHMSEGEVEDEVINIIEAAFFISNGIKLLATIILAQSDPTIGQHIWEIKYRLEELYFEELKKIKKASELQIGDFILYKKAVLEIDDIELEFLNDEVAELYADDDEDVKPAHTLYTFYCFLENGREVAIESRHSKKFIYLGNEELRNYFYEDSDGDELEAEGSTDQS
jgi:hypothetical protein